MVYFFLFFKVILLLFCKKVTKYTEQNFPFLKLMWQTFIMASIEMLYSIADHWLGVNIQQHSPLKARKQEKFIQEQCPLGLFILVSQGIIHPGLGGE